MFENIINFFKKLGKNDKESNKSKDAAKERLHLVLMQDRANISADFLALMKQEIIEVIKRYIDVDENAIDVRLTNKSNEDGTTGAPVLYANIPIMSVKEEAKNTKKEEKKAEKVEKEQEQANELEESEIIDEDKEEEVEEVIHIAEEIVESDSKE
ncbi:MAG: cell division topological specificity factor MinE [Clostridia bacterium]|nr:cell division topological specificity factor MinE [Clostridia bacterium]